VARQKKERRIPAEQLRGLQQKKGNQKFDQSPVTRQVHYPFTQARKRAWPHQTPCREGKRESGQHGHRLVGRGKQKVAADRYQLVGFQGA